MDRPCDLLIIGGGINGAAIARDAAGRGLSVCLVEQGDIAGATSSASSKMIHGGLRYLEHYEFRLVAEALAEREVMLKIAPHLARPLAIVMPHVKRQRPAWMIRLGLLLYDNLGRLRHDAPRTTLPASSTVDLRRAPFAGLLHAVHGKGFVYSDVIDDDARLTLATARSAAGLGAVIRTRTRCLAAHRDGTCWRIQLEHHGQRSEAAARAVVNAAGPWVSAVLAACLPQRQPPQHGSHRPAVQLIKGSHIVVPRLYAGDHGWLLQNDDHRVVFVLPFEEDYSLIGTTEIKLERSDADTVAALDAPPTASAGEIDYLCRAVGRFFRQAPQPADVVWSYAGLRPLFDDGHGDPAAVTRDYTFLLDAPPDAAPLLSIFGGKLTTHRRLAEAALTRLAPWFPDMGRAWTASQALPGGEFADFTQLLAELRRSYPALPAGLLQQLARRHGSLTAAVLGTTCGPDELGRDFGGGLFEREVAWFVTHEWAQDADDVLWRRSKAGLRMRPAERAAFAAWFAERYPAPGLEAKE
ncbi:Glycerol-3-phosphate dehydrogenase [Sterolibacterium denitrificans]|uniref:Glycerol-3-phosphate dehydrogenase n=1 Tax=Sterolibacterium denitrificans TaxID=157592 RepID=A0A7Z7MVM9_9PROT|nr:glycerol-3-phosphate dehydrogenase [Sterolibacterium denitrificans]SMB28389.1 Glycerol-3-phosphate dehydrogenase [Sterolibacterium denitrificans]